MALSGMTGFARSEGALGPWSWSVEARSVNGRNLETRFRGPSGFDALEPVAREAAQSRFRRGQLNVALQARRVEIGGRARINTAELEALIQAARPYVERGEAAAPRFDGLLSVRGVLEAVELEESADARVELEAAIASPIREAMDGLAKARGEEGTALEPVLSGLIDQIDALRAAAVVEAAGLPELLKARFAARIGELTGDAADLPPERIAHEAALLAVKADVREELDRLAAHVAAARTLISGEAAAGRRLDFLTQEFMREANTLCSKSASRALTTLGLELKALIEQFREQV